MVNYSMVLKDEVSPTILSFISDAKATECAQETCKEPYDWFRSYVRSKEIVTQRCSRDQNKMDAFCILGTTRLTWR